MVHTMQQLSSAEVKEAIRVSGSHVSRFGNWSGDCNPLHVDPAVASRTYFGRPIVHGALVVLEALAAVRDELPERLARLDVEFREAVYPEQAYEVCLACDQEQVTVEVGPEAASALIIRCAGERQPAEVCSARTDWVRALKREELGGSRRERPADRELDQLRAGLELSGVYSAAGEPDENWVGGPVTPAVAKVLALCSYLVGMELPGLRSLFTRLRLQFDGAAPADVDALAYRLRITRCDRAFRMVDASLEVATCEGVLIASAELRSYVRFSPTTTDLSKLSAALDRSKEGLAGKVALVCGASRGLGADLAAALAISGCRVYAAYRSSRADAERLNNSENKG
ncbi:MAG: hypothetical protein GXP27_07855 [Planctomycetes bacterium]|nr:hypothetical protein [Planctomycetota bacterium]